MSWPARPAGAVADAPTSGGRPARATTTSVHAVLDHVTVAVGDLDRAGAAWSRLGFVLKPGRRHANSIRNLHAKFADGTEVELITATEPRDRLAREYIRLAREGDGGAFAAIRVAELKPLREGFAAHGCSLDIREEERLRWMEFEPRLPCRPLWFFEGKKPWIDKPAWFAHRNGATRLASVWLDAACVAPPDELLAVFSRRLGDAEGEGAGSGSWPLGETTAMELRHAPVPVAGRPIVGITVEVERLETVRRVLAEARLGNEGGRDARGDWIRVAPRNATGIWVEFLKPNAR